VSIGNRAAAAAGHPVRRTIAALAAVLAIALMGYTLAGYLKGLGLAASAVWAVIVMVIYAPPVLVLSGLIALAVRGRLARVGVAAAATAAILGASLLLMENHTFASIAALVGAGTTLLLAMVPPRAPR